MLTIMTLIACLDEPDGEKISTVEPAMEPSTDPTTEPEDPVDTEDTAVSMDTADTEEPVDTEDTEDGRTAEAVCERWNSDRADLNEGTWSGSVNGCNAGDISENGRANALRLVNLYRWLAELPEVSTSSSRNEAAQKCALILEANSYLTHYPPEDSVCYDELGAETAAQSNISPYPGVYSVDLYISDPGNESTLGHRRWILSNALEEIGLGSASNYSCMQVFGNDGNANAQWTAWPPPGPVPIDVLSISWASTNETGFSIQSDFIDLQNADVSVQRDDGATLPVAVTSLAQWYGSQFAINIVPAGWVGEAGHSYTISVTGINDPFDYTIDFVDCGN